MRIIKKVENWRFMRGATKSGGTFSVKDNGPGIPPEYHEQVFGLFYRLDANEDGTGVGLAVVKKIMKLHGGDIQVDPETGRAGEGTVFRFSFSKQQSN